MVAYDPQHFWTFLQSIAQWFENNPVRLAIAMAGSAISHMFFQIPGSDIRPRLRRLFPSKKSEDIEMLQFMFITIAGGVVAICLLKPQNDTASFLGGFSWYTTLQQVSRKAR